MAKVSLRSYNREIESMVDRGQLDEAIAHSRHILNVFPKNLDTYRLLGKAYLEARRYNEATDIFERMLMAVPDDFVANVGMSIIRDEQNELDAAIWHMQRAFEVQPSNAAIQSELQRLFGRRDGVEPPKIRLTRGALAHMYVQGELYPQAISEIKAVLEEDRERHDMRVLLARAYFHAGQKNEAAEVCSQLLTRYPYCFDANRVLVELLPETERGESTQVYRRRVNDLDPYAAFTTGSIFHTEEVPDAAVSLERLEWDGQPVDLRPEWQSSLGIDLTEGAAAGEKEPDWLRADYSTGAFNASVPGEEPAPVSSGDDDIPDFLREAGWGRDTGAFKEGPGNYETSDESVEEAELAEGELPDWIKAMAPSGASFPGSTPPAEPEEDLTQDEVPDWLQGLGTPQQPSTEESALEEGDMPDWLASLKPSGETLQEGEKAAEAAGEEDLPAWFAAMQPGSEAPQETPPEEGIMAEPAHEEEIPDWMGAMKPAGDEPQPEEEWAAEPAGEEDLPAWIAGMQSGSDETQVSQPEQDYMAKPAGEEGLPDWITTMQQNDETPQEPSLQEGGMAEPAREEDLPDWIAAMKPPSGALEESQPDSALMAEPTREEDLPDWIAAMKTAGETAQPEESKAEPAAEEELPDWLQAIQREEELAPQDMPTEISQEPAQEFPEMSSESLSDWQIEDDELAGAVDFDKTDTGALGTSANEQDDAIAWLESLAAKHGAKPEELVTKPEERSETEPEWIRQARAAKEPAEAPSLPEEVKAAPSEELPEFLAKRQIEPAETVIDAVPPVDADVTAPSAQEQDDAIAWLESLAAKHGAKPEELVTDPSARKETAPEWVQREAEAASSSQPPEEPFEGLPEQTEPAREEAGPVFAELEDTQLQSPPSAEAAPPEEPFESVPEWIEPAREEAAQVFAELEDTQPHKTQPPALDETGIWLRDLDQGTGSVSELEPGAEEPLPAMGMDEDVPEWLREIESEAPKAEAGQVSEIEAQVPEWLSEIEIEAGVSRAEAGLPSEEEAQEAPDWLSEMKAEAPAPEAAPLPEAEPQEVPDWLLGVEPDSTSTEPFPAFPPQDESPVEAVSEAELQRMEAPVDEDESFTDWLKKVQPEETGAPADETVLEEKASDELPSWLAGLEEERAEPEPVARADEDLPEWLRAVDEPVAAEPTIPTDWQPAEFTAPSVEELSAPAVEPEPAVEEPPVQAAPPPTPEPEAPQAEPVREPKVEPMIPGRPGMTGMLSAAQNAALAQAQIELTRGNISGALDSYGKLIRKGRMLDEIIFDLREALYRYPVDVSILQTLGDAYMRANRLQDALDSYTKAEELLR